MRYSDEATRSRLSLSDISNWEFKAVEFDGSRPTIPSRDDLADKIAAFANANGGVLLCGVTDDGDIQDMSREQVVELDKLLVELSYDSIRPAVRIRTHHRQLDGKTFILVEIPQGHSENENPGGSYVRVGGSKRSMASVERMRIKPQRGQARFRPYDQHTVPGTGLGTLDESLWRPLLSAEGAVEPQVALKKLGLLASDDGGVVRATVAGVLLCTRNPGQWLHDAVITATRYTGNDRASGQIDSQEFSGPLNRQIGDAVAFAIRNMRVGAHKAPARINLPQYSEKALFEAIVNAVVHRDYSMRGSRIRLSIFEDRLEVQSPGSLPKNLTLASMGHRLATRNEALISVLARMPVEGIRGATDRRYFMERRGDGVSIILRETWEISGRRPEFRLVDNSEVLIIIPAAATEQIPGRAVITVRANGKPLPGADVLTLFPNKTWKRATTDENGEAEVELHTTHLPMTVFAAAPGHGAHVEREWIPSQRSLSVELAALRDGGSVIFTESAGYVPVIKGGLNPIRDSLDRTYLYASNIAVNQGKQQPVHFVPGEDLSLTDADGREATVRVVEVVGDSALLEYETGDEEPARAGDG